MRCSTLQLEEDDTKGTSVPCRLLEYTTDGSELQEIVIKVYILTGEFKLQTRQMKLGNIKSTMKTHLIQEKVYFERAVLKKQMSPEKTKLLLLRQHNFSRERNVAVMFWQCGFQQ
jgi:hypothetical protein